MVDAWNTVRVRIRVKAWYHVCCRRIVMEQLIR